jgi:hypothetical protein
MGCGQMAKRAEKQERLVDQGSGGKFGLSRATIYRPIEQKKLATLKIGARRLVRFHERYRPCRIDPTLSMVRFSGESDERLNWWASCGHATVLAALATRRALHLLGRDDAQRSSARGRLHLAPQFLDPDHRLSVRESNVHGPRNRQGGRARNAAEGGMRAEVPREEGFLLVMLAQISSLHEKIRTRQACVAKELIRTRRAVDDLQMSVEQVAVEAGLGLLYGEADPSRSGSSARDPSSPGQDKQTARSRGCGGGRFTLDASRCLTRAPAC